MSYSSPKVVDLFCGAGLFGHAFSREGFDVAESYELDKTAAATCAANHRGHVSVVDLSKYPPHVACDVIIAGPPCQGFSTLGKRDPNDPRNRLSLVVPRWAVAANAKVVVIENVAAFLESKIYPVLISRLRSAGYATHGFTVNAFDFGVPQNRSRSFTIAWKESDDVSPFDGLRKFPGPRSLTVHDAIGGLPKCGTVADAMHVESRPGELAAARMRVIPPGGDKRDIMRLAPDLCPPSWWKVTDQVTDVWGRMHWDQPANTLRTCLANPSKGRYIHPEEDRCITLREAARIHTIDDSYVFLGKKYSVAKQIGNSVPPRLGRCVARSIMKMIK